MPGKVEDEEGLEKVKNLLEAEIIGIDIEWRPTLMSFITAKPSIIQIVSENTYAIFDLFKLKENHTFVVFIGR